MSLQEYCFCVKLWWPLCKFTVFSLLWLFCYRAFMCENPSFHGLPCFYLPGCFFVLCVSVCVFLHKWLYFDLDKFHEAREPLTLGQEIKKKKRQKGLDWWEMMMKGLFLWGFSFYTKERECNPLRVRKGKMWVGGRVTCRTEKCKWGKRRGLCLRYLENPLYVPMNCSSGILKNPEIQVIFILRLS